MRRRETSIQASVKGPGASWTAVALTVVLALLVSACAVTSPRPAPIASGGTEEPSPGPLKAPGSLAPEAIATGSQAGVTAPAALRGLPGRLAARPAKVVMLLPLSASAATGLMAKGMREAAELALFDHAGTRGASGAPIELSVKDDQGSPEGARRAFAEAQAEGAEVILGPVFAASVAAIAPLAREARLPVIAFSNDRKVAAPGVFLMSFLAEDEVQRIVGFAARAGHRRVAGLLPSGAPHVQGAAQGPANGGYERLLEVALTASLAHEGSTLVALERYPLEANGMIEPVQRLALTIEEAQAQGNPITALFVAGDRSSLSTLGAVLKTTSIDTSRIKLFGIGDFADVGPERSGVFEGAWYPAADPQGWRDFAARYQRTYGSSPPRIASLAYDAVSLTIEAAGQSAGQDKLDAGSLVAQANLVGVDGPVRLQPDGLPSRSLAILEAHARGPAIADPPAALAEPLPIVVAEPKPTPLAVFHSTN